MPAEYFSQAMLLLLFLITFDRLVPQSKNRHRSRALSYGMALLKLERLASRQRRSRPGLPKRRDPRVP